jgi:hypothetical protein
MAPGELQFAAFLSYSRRDKRLALWLVRALEDLRLPAEAETELLTRQSRFTAVRPVFRDESDMPVGGAIPTRLAEVLDASAAMIVLVTPASAQSAWVNEEIARFAERHPDRPIIPAVAEGDPDRNECYPPALLRLGKPLAADLRTPADRWQAVVKIAAAVLRLDVDRLVGRIAKRREQRQKWMMAAAGAGGAAFAWLAFTAWQMSNRASEENNRALATVEVALTDTRARVSARDTLATRAAVLAVAEAYFDRKPSELSEEELRLKAEMLVQKGVDARERKQEEESLRVRQAAFAVTEELLARKPDDADRLFDHGQKAFYVAEMHWRRGELEDAQRFSDIYWAASQRLVEVMPGYPGAALELAYANTNLGVLRLEQFRDPRGAEAVFAEAVRVVAAMAADLDAKRNLNLAYANQVRTRAQFDGVAPVLELAGKWATVIDELEAARHTDRNLNYQVVRHLILLSEVEERAGRQTKADAHRARALKIAGEELRSDPDNKRWLELASKLDLLAGSAECQQTSATPDFNFADAAENFLAMSCLRRGSMDARPVCSRYAAWLPAQKPNFEAEPVWAAMLGLCSRDPAVSLDRGLADALDRAAEERFFSNDPQGFSLSTQTELAQFNSAGRNTVRIREIREDLKRRGWNGSQS